MVFKYDTLMQADEIQFTEISIYRSVHFESCKAVICVALCSVCACLVVNLSSTHPAVVLIKLLCEL